MNWLADIGIGVTAALAIAALRGNRVASLVLIAFAMVLVYLTDRSEMNTWFSAHLSSLMSSHHKTLLEVKDGKDLG